MSGFHGKPAKRRKQPLRAPQQRQVVLQVEPLEEMDLFSGPGDDYGDTLAEAFPLPLPSAAPAATVVGEIGVAGDVDLFQITAMVDGTLSVRQQTTELGGVARTSSRGL